jgi:RNA polymerase sigma-70 factor (ECF subfamily)
VPSRSDAPDPPRAPSDAPLDVAALFVEHGPFLLRSVQRMTGDGPHVEDIVQETFLVAHRRREEIAGHPQLRGWLFRVAQNLVLHHRRSVARRIRLEEAAEVEPKETKSEVSGPVRAARERDEVRATVAELPEHEQAVFILYELEELPGAEIARVLDIPLGTVWTRLRAARKRFRELWAARAAERGEEVAP